MLYRRPWQQGTRAPANPAGGTTARSLAPAFTLLAAAFVTAAPASAAEYPWCYIDQTMSGATYCAFETLAQCRENAGGNGGTCVQNPDYRGTSRRNARRNSRR